jgi:hypothetical protein
MRNLATTVCLAALAVALGAGCSSTHAATPSTSSSTTAPRVGVVATTPKQAAIALGRRLLDEAVLPEGAQVSSAPAPDALRGPSSSPAMSNLVFAHRIWTVDESPHTVWQWLQAHTPRGFVKDGTSSGTSDGVPSWGVQDRLSVFPANTSYAELELGVAADASGKSVVRVDTEVGWTAPRPANEFVPASDHVVTVSVVREYAQRGSRVIKRVVASDPKLVEPIVRAFDALRVSPDSVHSCPPITTRTVSYHVAFSPSPKAPPDVVATIGKCGGVGVTVAGRPAPNLGEFSDAAFADAVAHVLGLPHPHFN